MKSSACHMSHIEALVGAILPLTSLQYCPRKNDTLLRGAEVTPSSSTAGTDDGRGFGSEYGLSLSTASRYVAITGGEPVGRDSQPNELYAVATDFKL